MDGKAFLKYLISTHKITEKQAKHCLQMCLSEKKGLAQVLIQEGYFTLSALKQCELAFKNSSLNANVEATPSPSSLEKNLLEDFQQFFKAKESNSTLNHQTIVASSHSKENTHLLPAQKGAGDVPVVQKERYEVLQTLGEGGMGVVQLVKDTLLGREVALKKIKATRNHLKTLTEKQKAMLWRLNKEASITAILEHPNIVPLYEMQQQEEEISFTMRKVEGCTLRTLLKAKREGEQEYDENKLLGIYLKVCDAIAYAHSKRILHRDLKPDNIMVGHFGEVYVMDWGIAKKQENLEESDSETQVETILKKTGIGEETEDEQKTRGGMGTEGYMAPEQRENAALVTSQSDIYALGTILRECFVLLSPSEEFAKQIEENRIQLKHSKYKEKVEEKSPEKSIPKEIQAIVEKATQIEPSARYKSVKELSQDIERYQKNMTVSVKEYNLLEVLLKWLQRHKQQVGFASVLLLMAISSIGFQVWKSKKEEQAKLKDKEERFEQTLRNAIKQKEEAQKIPQIGLKIGSLLYALNYLNAALALKPQDPKTEQEKLEIGETLLTLCYETKDYQLAGYVAREMQALSLSLNTRKKWEEEVNIESGKTLKQHQEKFSELETKFRNKTLTYGEGERVDAIFEISKMQEKEIFEKLIEILKEGTEYFQGEPTKQNIKTTEFYKVMVEALGRLENPETGPYLIEALKSLKKKIPLQEQAEKTVTIDFMVFLSEALANSRALKQSKTLDTIRWEMGVNSLFWQRTTIAFQKLASGLISDYDEAIRLTPQSADAYNNRGLAKNDSRNFVGAIKDYDEAIRLNPQLFEAYNNRGNAKAEIKDFVGAIKDYDEAIRLNPQYVLAYNNRGNAKKESRDFVGAISDYDEVIRLNPRSAEAYNNRGNAKNDSRDFVGAISDFEEAIRLNPQLADAYNNRGISKKNSKDFVGAIKDYDEVIRLNPYSVDAYNNRGNAKKESKDFVGAIFDYNEAIRLNPKFVLAYYNRGLAKKESRDFAGAISDFEEAIRLNPQYAFAYYNRGLAKAESKDFVGAISDFDEIIRLNPQFAFAYYYRGMAKAGSSNFVGAISDFDDTIHLNPQFAEAYYNRGLAKYNKGENIQAKADFQKYLELTKNATDAQTQQIKQQILQLFSDLDNF